MRFEDGETIELGIKKLKRENPSFRGKRLRQLKEEGWAEYDRRKKEKQAGRIKRKFRDAE